MRSLLVLVSFALATSQLPPDASADYSYWSTKLHNDLLAGYNKHVVPTSNRSALGTKFSAAGTDVQLAVRIFKVIAVKAADGAMELKVWLRMYWVDHRLSWNPADYGNITKTHFWLDHDGNSQLWQPDVQPYNGLQGLVTSLDPGYARVESTGDIFWSRPGMLNVMCKFSGLTAFPFDNLKCAFEFGGWAFSGEQQGILLKGSGYDFSAQEATQGSTYQEYTISEVSVDRINYEYPCCPSEPWPVVMYTITLNRADNFYVVIIIVPTFIVTMLSFVVFWAPSNAGDALGFGITVIVVVILMQVVLIDLLPICGEILWVDIVVSVSYVVCMMSLFQSAFVILSENNESEHLLPLYIIYPAKSLWRRCRKLLCLKDRVGILEGSISGNLDTMDPSGWMAHVATLAESTSVVESIAGVQYRLYGPGGQRTAAGLVSTGAASDGRSMPMTEEDKMRLIFFEKLFFDIDDDNTGTVSEEECQLLMSFTALDMAYDERAKVFRNADKVADGHLTRMEFCELCRTTFWDMPLSTIEISIENLKCARMARRDRYKSYWRSLGDSIESYARPLLPSLYIMANIILFSLEFDDDYMTNQARLMGESGYLQVKISSSGIVWVSILCVAIFIIFTIRRFFLMLNSRIADKAKMDEIEAVRALNLSTAQLNKAKKSTVQSEDVAEVAGAWH